MSFHNINNNSANTLKEKLEKCSQEVSKLRKQLTQIIIADGNIFTSKTNNNNKKNIFFNSTSNFNANTLVKNYGFSPKIASQVAYKLRKSGKTPNHYSLKTGLLKKR